jgi:hypothetical protein
MSSSSSSLGPNWKRSPSPSRPQGDSQPEPARISISAENSISNNYTGTTSILYSFGQFLSGKGSSDEDLPDDKDGDSDSGDNANHNADRGDITRCAVQGRVSRIFASKAAGSVGCKKEGLIMISIIATRLIVT